jgi:hypothetical protein
MTSRALAEPLERFSVYLVPTWTPGSGDGNSDLTGALTVMWGSTALSTSWRVNGPK